MYYITSYIIILFTGPNNPGNLSYLRQRRLCFGCFVFLFAHLSVSKIIYKVMNRLACMKLLSEVYLGSRNNLINLGDHADYDTDTGSGLRSVPRLRSLQALTYCLVLYFIGVQLPLCSKMSN